MKMIKSYLVITFVLIAHILMAQTISSFCNHTLENDYHERIMRANSSNGDLHNLGLTSVPVAFTFLMSSDGSSSYYKGLENEIMDSITSHFLPAGIHFYMADDPVFIQNDLVYDFVIGDHVELLYPGLKNNRINIVIPNSISYSSGGGVCGVAQIFPNTVFTRYSCIPGNTISHEIGHELGLAHTHHTAFGIELVDGSNCETAGDLICDTPADPNRGDLITSDCIWEGTYEDELGYDIHLVDANGDRYDPDLSNLMSYYGLFGCRNDFTFLQSVVMQDKLSQKLPNYGYETPKMTFEVYQQEDLCAEGYRASARIKNPSEGVEYYWDFENDGVNDASGTDVQYTYSSYGEFTIKVTMKYPDGREFYQSQVCVISYSNESIDAPFLDDFNTIIERDYVNLIEESAYKWNLKLHLTNGRIVAGDQIHINEKSIMEYSVNISNMQNPILEFEYDCNTNALSGGDSLLIELITCDQSLSLFEKWGQNLGTNGIYKTETIALPNTTEDIVNIRFTSKGDSDVWHELYIDNIQVYDDAISSIEKETEEIFHVYPNPTNSYLNIHTDLEIENLWLIDMLGNRFIHLFNGNSVDLTGLPSGIYFLNVHTDSGKYSQKIVKVD